MGAGVRIRKRRNGGVSRSSFGMEAASTLARAIVTVTRDWLAPLQPRNPRRSQPRIRAKVPARVPGRSAGAGHKSGGPLGALEPGDPALSSPQERRGLPEDLDRAWL